MKIKSLGLKVSLIVALMIAVIIVIIVFIVSTQSLAMILDLSANEAKGANTTFVKEMENLQDTALTRARIIAYSNDVIDAILRDDEPALKGFLINYGEGVDTVMVCDANGDVISRMHNDNKGDNVANQDVVSVALNTGTGFSTIAKGATVGLATRGSAAIKDYDGNIIGAVVCGHDLANPEYVEEVKEYTGSEVTIFDGDTRLMTTVLNESGDRAVGTQASDAVKEAVLDRKEHYAGQVTLFGKEFYAHYSPLIVDGTVIGMLFNGVPIEHALQSQQNMMRLVIIAGVACGVACLLLVFVFNIFAVSRPLKKIGVFAKKIRTGELGISVASDAAISVHSHDEIGVLARELEASYIQLQGYVGEIKERMHGLADGDLVTESVYDFQGDFVLIKDSINEIVQNFNQILNEVNSASTEVSTGAKQVADGAQSLAQGSTEQAATIEELSASISDISEKTKTNAQMAGRAASLADTIRDNAEKGSSQMDGMIGAVKEINQSSQDISKVIKVIDDIAFQTNILALNAAVEAARAGQHGKGFAVVAEEVRNLASKSAEAAKDTAGLIENSMEKAELGSRIAGETAGSLSEIVSGINESAALFTDIAKSSEEQSSGIGHINVGISHVEQVVQQNSATAEESAAASEEMHGQAEMLQQLIKRFRLR